MKKVFKIYPALFILGRNQQRQPVIPIGKLWKSGLSHDSKEVLFNGHPQKCYGDCRLNAEGTLVSVHVSSTIAFSSMVDLPEVIFTMLEPVRHQGRDYTLTYLPVNN